MASFIESLESRTLFSGGAAVEALAAEGKALGAATKALGKIGVANTKLIVADIKAAGTLKANAALLKTLAVDGVKGFAALAKAEVRSHALISRDVAKGEVLVALLRRRPGNVLLEAKLSQVATTLQNDAAAGLAAITNDLTALHDTNSANFTALLGANAANAKLQADAVNTISPNAIAGETAVSTYATTALTTDVEAVIASA
jgi:hypothetical protein